MSVARDKLRSFLFNLLGAEAVARGIVASGVVGTLPPGVASAHRVFLKSYYQVGRPGYKTLT